MTQNEFLDFARNAARLATSTPGTIGNLVLTQERTVGEPTLREPEMRTALQLQATKDDHLYGIEVPTRENYIFTGKSARGRRALVDFALLDSVSPRTTRDVLIELKEGQPHRKKVEHPEPGQPIEDVPTITKDLEKLLKEPVQSGRCVFHICQATDSGTIPTLRKKYNTAMGNALGKGSGGLGEATTEPWFVLLFLVLHQRGKASAGLGACLHIGIWKGTEWNVHPDSYFP